MPEISIVMPMYNGERYLAETVESVVGQTHFDWELVIMDDGSSDSSPALAETLAARDSRIRFVTQPNAGPTAARNHGVTKTTPTSDYLIFLDQDDVWEPSALEILADALRDHPDAMAACGAIRYIDREGRPFDAGAIERFIRQRRGTAETCDVLATFAGLARHCGTLTPGQMLFRRSGLDAAGLFDPNLGTAADWDLLLRLSGKGGVLFTEQVILNYRQHGSSMSQDGRKLGVMEEVMYRKWLTAPELTDEQRETVWRGHCWRDWDSAGLRWAWARESLARRQWVHAAKQMRHMLIDAASFGMGMYVRDRGRQVPGRQAILTRLHGGAWKDVWGYQKVPSHARLETAGI